MGVGEQKRNNVNQKKKNLDSKSCQNKEILSTRSCQNKAILSTRSCRNEAISSEERGGDPPAGAHDPLILSVRTSKNGNKDKPEKKKMTFKNAAYLRYNFLYRR